MEIGLTKGYVTIIDDDDFERVSKHKWYAQVLKNQVYAVCDMRRKKTGNGKFTYLHSFIIGEYNKQLVVDHINRNTLDNRKENLRIVTKGINLKNSDRKYENKHGFLGVKELKYPTMSGIKKLYYGGVKFNKKVYRTKFVKTPEEAHLLYKELEHKLYNQ